MPIIMNRTILAIAFLLTLIYTESKSQSIRILAYNYNQCTGNKFKVRFSSEGFNQSTSFGLELSYANQNNYYALNTERSGDTLMVTLPTNVNIPVPNQYYAFFVVRVASSSPRVVSKQEAFQIYDKINVSFSGETIASPYQSVMLTPQEKGSLPYTVTFSNGKTLSTGNSYNPTGGLVVSSDKTMTYTPVSVSNMCGEGTFSGNQTVKVQPIDLRISSTSLPGIYCKGASFHVSIIRSSAFNPDNEFIVQCRSYNGTYQNCLTTMINDTLLSAQIPTETTIEQISSLRVLATNPEIVGREFSTSSQIIPIHSAKIANLYRQAGQNYSLVIAGNTVGKSSYTFSNGEVYSNSGSSGSGSSYYFTIPASKTPKTYTLVSAVDMCGDIPIDEENNSVTSTPLPAQTIYSRVSELSICKGVKSPVEIPVAFESEVVDNGDFQINFFRDSTWPLPPEFVTTGRLSEDKKSITVNFPDEVYKEYENNPYYNYFYIQISNPSYFISSLLIKVNINSLPKGSICCDITIPNRQTVSFQPSVSGGAPYTVELNDGTKDIIDSRFNYTLKVSPTKTTDYFIKTISNVCGEGTASQSVATVRVLNPSDFNIEMAKLPFKSICAGNSADIHFNVTGTAPTGTKYKVELVSRNNGHILNLGSATTSPIRVSFPADTNAYGPTGDYVHMKDRYIRIRTEDDKVVSNDYPLLIKTLPKAFFDRSYSTYNTDLAATLNSSLFFKLTGGEPFYWSFNNEPEKLSLPSDFYYTAPRGEVHEYLETVFQEGGEYRFTSIRNECGVGTIPADQKLIVKPFIIQAKQPNFNYSTLTHCLGGTYPIGYTIPGSIPDVDLKVQISKDGTTYSDLEVVKQEKGLIWIKYPDNLAPASYQLRLKAKDYEIFSENIYIYLYPLPSSSVTMRTDDGKQVGFIDDISRGYSCIRITSINNGWEAWVENAPSAWTAPYKEACFTVYPTEATTYTLKKIVNVCGYADIKNTSVDIEFTPKIELREYNYYVCAGGSFKMSYQSVGKFDSSTDFVITVDGGGKTWELFRKKDKSFIGDIKIPEQLKEGIYYGYIRASTSSRVVSSMFVLYVTNIPSAEMIDGSTIANPDQFVSIPIKVSGALGNARLTFIDGSILSVSGDYAAVQKNFTQTTTIELKSITNACGTVPAKGKFTVNVNPKSSKTITPSVSASAACRGEKVLITFSSQGINGQTKYQAQMSDERGVNFKDIKTEPYPNYPDTFWGYVPEDTKAGSGYRFRIVVPGNNEIQYAATGTPVIIRENFVVTVSYQKAYYTPDEPAEIKFDLTGDAPWGLIYSDTTGNNRIYLSITKSPYILKLKPINNNTAFKILQTSSQACAKGIIKGEHPFRIEVLTATENEAVPVIIYPNPTEQTLRIDAQVVVEKVSITDLTGKLLRTITKDNYQDTIDLSDLPTATFIVEVFVKNQSYKYKIVKL